MNGVKLRWAPASCFRFLETWLGCQPLGSHNRLEGVRCAVCGRPSQSGIWSTLVEASAFGHLELQMPPFCSPPTPLLVRPGPGGPPSGPNWPLIGTLLLVVGLLAFAALALWALRDPVQYACPMCLLNMSRWRPRPSRG